MVKSIYIFIYISGNGSQRVYTSHKWAATIVHFMPQCTGMNREETENSLLSGKYQIKSSTANFRFRPIMVQDIREAITKLTTSKSFGTDTISSYFLKMALPFLENPIAMLFNTSLETSIFPDIWKISRVAPIYKEGDKSEKSNYRPISVLPVISRLFERLVYDQLYQHLNSNGVESKLMDINIGVPQGSCLGPLLFIIYINDLPQAVKNSTVAMYADDTSLSYRSGDIRQLSEVMNKDLTTIVEWLKGNKLSLNVSKTKAMVISTKQKERCLAKTNEELSLVIQEERIDTVLAAKYLVIKVDRNLNWKGHIKALSSTVSRAIGFLKHAKSFLHHATLKTLYTGIIEPHFRFCCSVWGNCGAIEKNQLQKLQNRAARILTNSRYDADARTLLNILGLKTIHDLIETETNTMAFKALNGLAPEYLSKLFIRNSETHLLALRNTSTYLQLPKKRTSNGQKYFSYKGVKSWNCLPLEIKQASSLKVFKTMQK